MHDWLEMGDGLRRREYPTYDKYIDIQAEKLSRRPGFAKNYSDGLRGSLYKRLSGLRQEIDLPLSGNVLCLGARVGGEVEAFIMHSYYAIGIDVNPGIENSHVLHGDFHDLTFPDRSVDIVYTNSLDHVLDMEKLAHETWRVLKDGGIFLTENKGGTKEPGFRGSKSDGYDCMEWLSLQHLIDYITSMRFELIHRYRFRGFTPWGIVYKKKP